MLTTIFKNNFCAAICCLFFFIEPTSAQVDTLYYNFKEEQVSKEVFKNKLKDFHFEAIRYSTDTLVVELLRPSFLFGKVDSNVKSQLFKLFSVRHKIDTTKILSIFYIDTLKAKKDYPRKNYILVQDQFGNILGKENFRSDWIFPEGYIDIRKYYKGRDKDNAITTPIYNYKTFIKGYKSYLRLHKKYKNVVPLIFYNVHSGTQKEFEEIKVYKDYGHLIKKLFYYKDERPRHIILKSNGEYYVGYGYEEGAYYELFDEKEWNKQKDKFLKWKQ